jgi:peptidoglycan hydrolase-like protein with peptidoglycan-binding domain
LRRGSTGDAVGNLQTMLQKLKFLLAIDQDFGAATELAVMRFQTDKKLTVDVIVGKETWDAIELQKSEAVPYPRANFLYLMRFGSTESSPSRRFLSSS